MGPGTCPVDGPNRTPRTDSTGTLVASIGKVFRGRGGSARRLHSDTFLALLGPQEPGRVTLQVAPHGLLDRSRPIAANNILKRVGNRRLVSDERHERASRQRSKL